MEELPIRPHGLLFQTDFITPSHESTLLETFHRTLLPTHANGNSNTKSRISFHYGYTFDYKTFNIDPNIPYKPFPTWLQPLIPTTEPRPPDQVCLQYYPPGAGIPPHVDAHGPYDQLYALSLGAPAVMQFRRGDERVDVDLAPRSLMAFTGDSRLHWTHGIRKRKTDVLGDGSVRARGERWSLTYRWLREGECRCGDLALCDDAQRREGIVKVNRSVVAMEDKSPENGSIGHDGQAEQ